MVEPENDERLRERILEYVKSYHARNGLAPSMGRVAKHFHTYYKRLKKLFPGGALDVYNQAGVPIPKERLKQTEKAMRGRMMKLARQRRGAKGGEGEEPRMVESPTLVRHGRLVDALIQTFLESLAALHLSETSSPGVGDIADDAARRLLERIAEVDPDYLREILESSAYLDFIESYGILNFDLREGEIEEDLARRRRKWLDLLKRYHPELLADYLT